MQRETNEEPLEVQSMALNTFSTDDLLSRKERLEDAIIALAKHLGVPVDYAFAMVQSARSCSPNAEDHISLLEMLVEIEAIKYTLVARRLRELGEG
ncbi:MAG: hypothetical protein H7Y60_08210 [Rhodospirillaceae bacterium]|nr:hypothetical protein [Rhodospirillales bacterium]